LDLLGRAIQPYLYQRRSGHPEAAEIVQQLSQKSSAHLLLLEAPEKGVHSRILEDF